jgi:hypothetical protein
VIDSDHIAAMNDRYLMEPASSADLARECMPHHDARPVCFLLVGLSFRRFRDPGLSVALRLGALPAMCCRAKANARAKALIFSALGWSSSDMMNVTSKMG